MEPQVRQTSDYELARRPSTDVGARHERGHEPTPNGKVDDPALDGVIESLRRIHAVDFAGHKQNLLRAQIAARMTARGVPTAREYFALLDASSRERAALLEGLLVGSTRFFRDPAVFDAVRSAVLPRIVDPNHRAPLRVWVPACSTGEEAYSLAMLLLEYLDEAGDARPLRILATDVNAHAVAHAGRGTYGDRAMSSVSDERRERFFVATEDGSFRVRRRLRDAVVFGRHDLLTSPPYAHIDLVSCRNLLIYFCKEAQEQSFARLHYALAPQGVLLLGAAENVQRGEGLFAPLARQHGLYVKRHTRLVPADKNHHREGPP